jgi:hypothetical protein
MGPSGGLFHRRRRAECTLPRRTNRLRLLAGAIVSRRPGPPERRPPGTLGSLDMSKDGRLCAIVIGAGVLARAPRFSGSGPCVRPTGLEAGSDRIERAGAGVICVRARSIEWMY